MDLVFRKTNCEYYCGKCFKFYSIFSDNVKFKPEDRFKSEPFIGCYSSIDGTDCPIFEPTPFSSKWFSHKFHGAALRYEIAVSLSGDIIWVNGPYPAGSMSDVTIYRQGYKEIILSGERVLADRGYSDETCLTPDFIESQYQHFATSFRSRHEAVNGRIKRFSVCSSTFRHSTDKHGLCFHAVANIVQLAIRKRPVFADGI